MKRLFRIVFFTWSLYALTHLVAFTILPLAFLFDGFGRTRAVQRLKAGFAETVFWLVGQKGQVSGLQNLKPGARYVIVCNYPSGYALFGLMYLFPDAIFVAHEFISRVPLVGRFMRHQGTIFVDGRRPAASLARIDRATAAGLGSNVIILPEGGRSPDGGIHHFKRGFIRLLRDSGFDLLPITLNGFYTLKPAHRFYLDPDTYLQVLIHTPICADRLRAWSDTQLVETVEATIKGPYRP